MKKAMALLLTCALFAALAACQTTPGASPSQGDTKEAAYTTYMALADKLNAQPNTDAQYDVDMKMDMDMKYGGESMQMSMDGNMKIKVVGDKVQCAMVMNTDYGTMEIYSDGDKIYYSVDGVEQSMSMDELNAQISNSVNVPSIQKEAIQSCEVTTVGEDTKTTIVLDGSALAEMGEEMMGAQLAQLGDESNINMSDITYVIVTDKDGNPKTMDMDLEMKMDVMGESIDIKATYVCTFNKLGNGVDIDLSALAA